MLRVSHIQFATHSLRREASRLHENINLNLPLFMESKINKAFSPEDFRANGHLLIDLLADYLKTSQSNDPPPTISRETPDCQLKFWRDDFNSPLPDDPGELFKNILSRSINLYSRSCMGHQVPPPAPAAVLGSLLSSFLNNGSAVYEMGMTGNALEKIVTEKLAEKFGLGAGASGFVTSGGTLGNLTALLTARAAVTDMWDHGLTGHNNLAIMVSGESHYSVDRAARIMGLGSEGIIKVPVNDEYQLRTDLLDEYLTQAEKSGKRVFCVIGCACSTSTGAYDDLKAIGAFATKNKLWFHVDGAHGAAAIYSPKYKHLLNGIELADSMIIDFHKMMLTPSLSTAVIYKRASDSYKTFAQKAQYLWADQEKEEWHNSGKRTFECTKPMSIISIYTLMRMYGDELFKENIETLYSLAQEFAALIKANKNFELAYEPQSNIVCFRYISNGATEDINKKILQHLLADGRYYIVSTTLDEMPYLRTAIMNPLTRISDLAELLDLIDGLDL